MSAFIQVLSLISKDFYGADLSWFSDKMSQLAINESVYGYIEHNR